MVGLPLLSPARITVLLDRGSYSTWSRLLSCAYTKARPGEQVFDLQLPSAIGRSFSNYPNTGAWFSMSENKHFIIFIFPVKPRGCSPQSLEGLCKVIRVASRASRVRCYLALGSRRQVTDCPFPSPKDLYATLVATTQGLSIPDPGMWPSAGAS